MLFGWQLSRRRSGSPSRRSTLSGARPSWPSPLRFAISRRFCPWESGTWLPVASARLGIAPRRSGGRPHRPAPARRRGDLRGRALSRRARRPSLGATDGAVGRLGPADGQHPALGCPARPGRFREAAPPPGGGRARDRLPGTRLAGRSVRRGAHRPGRGGGRGLRCVRLGGGVALLARRAAPAASDRGGGARRPLRRRSPHRRRRRRAASSARRASRRRPSPRSPISSSSGHCSVSAPTSGSCGRRRLRSWRLTRT